MAVVRADDTIMPAVAGLTPERAAVELLTADAAPPGDAAEIANGLCRALAGSELSAYALNAGRVGGPEGVEGSREIGAGLAAKVLDAAASGSIEWERDPDFGYLTAASVPGAERRELELLCPRLLYGRGGRPYLYAELVERRLSALADAVEAVAGLDEAIVASAPRPKRELEDGTPRRET